jgi:hypothetical protein
VLFRSPMGFEVFDSGGRGDVGAVGGACSRLLRQSLRYDLPRPAAFIGGGNEIGWAVQVAPVDEWLAVSRRQLGAVREALEQG